MNLQNQDPEIFDLINAEAVRQQDGLEMIASENYTSVAIMEAAGSVLTNKYAEGYPGRRYYGGCEHVDVIENIARNRAKELFGAEAANVQPNSGSQANQAVYLTALDVGDTVLGLDLAHGGHLTHGMRLNLSGKLYNFINYGVTEDTHRIDFDQVAKLAKEHKPKMIVAGASAYPREIPHEKFREIADDVGALLFVDMAHYSGLVAGGVHNSPVPYADFVTSTTHKTLRGPRSGMILCKKKWIKKINSAVFPGMQGLCRIQVDARQAQVDQARAAIAKAKIDYNAARELNSEGFSSDTALATAKAALDLASANLKQAQTSLDQSVIRAPFEGTFDERMAEAGDFLGVGEPCGVVIQQSPYLVVGAISEREVGKVAVGDRGVARLVTGETIEGKVRFVARAADAATRTFDIELEIPNEGGTLRDGVTAEFTIDAIRQQAYLLKRSALVLNDAGEIGIRTVDDDGLVSFQPVTLLGDTARGMWVSGLTGTVNAITRGQEFVIAGQKVQVTFDDGSGDLAAIGDLPHGSPLLSAEVVSQ